jgi:DNA-binding MarR family transcriptional regulator
MRESFLELTRDGRDIYLSLVPEARRFVDTLLAPLAEDEKAMLDRLLTRLTSQAERLSANLEREAAGGRDVAAG